MIKVRTIEKLDDNSYYSPDAVTLLYESEDRRITFYLNPDNLYSTIHDYISSMAQMKEEITDNEEETLKRKMLSRLMKASIKGALSIWGNDLLDVLFGTKDHEVAPRTKGLDIVEWYMDQFSKIAVAHMMKNDIVLSGETSQEDDREIVVNVYKLDTRPVAEKQ